MPTTVPMPTVTSSPTATPTGKPTAAPTVTPMPTVLTNNKIECEIKDNKLIVSLNFEEDDEVMYVAFRKGNELKKIVTPDIHNMTAEVDLSDTEYDSIDVYVWNGNMKPYAEVKQIERYNPINEQEKKDKEIILDFINKNDDVLVRDNEIAHITSSGFIVNKLRTKVLMIHHNIYNSWGWTGGHADGDSDLIKVSIKEAKEETGIKEARPITNDICSIDILPVNAHIKRGKYVASHLHLSVAYILEADENEELVVKEDENSGVKWVDIDKVLDLTNEEYMKNVYKKLIDKSKMY